MAKFNYSHELYGYLGVYKHDAHVEQGFCKLGELPLGLDEAELSYLEEHADNDLDEDDSYSESKQK